MRRLAAAVLKGLCLTALGTAPAAAQAPSALPEGAGREWPSPSGPDSHPYAIAVVGGAVWYDESGTRPDMLVRFDPASERFRSWPIPSGEVHAGIVRHMRPTREGDLLIHQSSTNRILLVRLDRAAGPRAAAQ